jgi:hypothetical protein
MVPDVPDLPDVVGGVIGTGAMARPRSSQGLECPLLPRPQVTTVRSENHAVRQGDSHQTALCATTIGARYRRRRHSLAVLAAAAIITPVAAALLVITSAAGPARADPAPPPADPAVSPVCDDAFCTPGIKGDVVLGAPCDDTANYVFGTTSWGRLVFCGSPRRYEPRYFRAMPMLGIKQLGSNCAGYDNDMAQAPDGLFLTCSSQNGQPMWVRGDA